MTTMMKTGMWEQNLIINIPDNVAESLSNGEPKNDCDIIIDTLKTHTKLFDSLTNNNDRHFE